MYNKQINIPLTTIVIIYFKIFYRHPYQILWKRSFCIWQPENCYHFFFALLVRSFYKNEKMATELEIEMNPLTKSGRSQSKWSKIFVALAQTQEDMDIPLSIGGSGSSLIELEKLKSYIKSEGSFKVINPF